MENVILCLVILDCKNNFIGCNKSWVVIIYQFRKIFQSSVEYLCTDFLRFVLLLLVVVLCCFVCNLDKFSQFGVRFRVCKRIGFLVGYGSGVVFSWSIFLIKEIVFVFLLYEVNIMITFYFRSKIINVNYYYVVVIFLLL